MGGLQPQSASPLHTRLECSTVRKTPNSGGGMKRIYRVALVLDGTFQRKVNAEREAEKLLRYLKVKPPWVRVETKVSSGAMSERKPQVQEPSPRGKLKGGGLILGIFDVGPAPCIKVAWVF